MCMWLITHCYRIRSFSNTHVTQCSSPIITSFWTWTKCRSTYISFRTISRYTCNVIKSPGHGIITVRFITASKSNSIRATRSSTFANRYSTNAISNRLITNSQRVVTGCRRIFTNSYSTIIFSNNRIKANSYRGSTTCRRVCANSNGLGSGSSFAIIICMWTGGIYPYIMNLRGSPHRRSDPQIQQGSQHHGRQHRTETTAAVGDRAAFAVAFRYFGHNYVAISNFIPNNIINFIHDSILLSFSIWGMNIDLFTGWSPVPPPLCWQSRFPDDAAVSVPWRWSWSGPLLRSTGPAVPKPFCPCKSWSAFRLSFLETWVTFLSYILLNKHFSMLLPLRTQC